MTILSATRLAPADHVMDGFDDNPFARSRLTDQRYAFEPTRNGRLLINIHMRPLPKKFFGPDGIPCVFTIDDDGNTDVGFFVKQLGDFKFVVSNGMITKIVKLAQHAEDVADLTHMPVGLCTILVEQLGSDPEYIRRITEYRCSTIEGNTFGWHPSDPTIHLGGIITPDLNPPIDPDGGSEILLETGDFWLRQDGSGWDLETLFFFFLFQNGGTLTFENETGVLLLEAAPTPP